MKNVDTLELSRYDIDIEPGKQTVHGHSFHVNTLQQYWNWGKWAADPANSPLFDGSDTSLSGNGRKIDHGYNDYFPPGPGGGCIYSGPFVK